MLDIPEHYLDESDRAVFETAGYGKRQGLGLKPILLVVDMTYNFIGEHSLPILEAVGSRRSSCGEYGWQALPEIRKVIDLFRETKRPVVYTRISDIDFSSETSGFGSKNHRTSTEEQRELTRKGNRVVDEIAPEADEIVLDKQKPSAFFGTALQSYLVANGIDSVVLVGCTTSGCIRATAIDAFSLNYRVTVVKPCVFDRFKLSHHASLFDLDCKYADVVDVITLVASLRSCNQA